MRKDEKKAKPWLWTVLAVLHIVVVGFPLRFFLGAADEGARIFSAVVLVCAVLFLVILDIVTTLMANFNVNEL